jgi:hypothetical protein
MLSGVISTLWILVVVAVEDRVVLSKIVSCFSSDREVSEVGKTSRGRG